MVGLAAAHADTNATVPFNAQVRPILAEKCFKCHGADKAALKANLRLDQAESATAGHKGVRAIVPGDLAKSELVRRITSADPDSQMPPPKENKPLTANEIDVLKRWITGGAEYQPHWAFIPPQRSAPPKSANAARVKNPIDNFILARLDAEHLEAAAEADRVTLCRRLYFDLVGLPPTPEEVDALVNDARPDAYEKLVDNLLASPHYGERMAMRWLDYVRYADTNGYHGDEYRSVWPYRDYVINAFNANMPFDRFTTEQLAGDLLPDATRDQRIASGYNRLNQLTAEGGAQPKEYESIYAADRVRTAASAWLGATMNCCQCHDHKFDPFTQKDFYSFAAYFADIEERAVYSAGGPWDPTMPLPTPEQEAQLKKLDDETAEKKKSLDTQTPELDAAQQAWEAEARNVAADPAKGWNAVKPAESKSSKGTQFETLDDYSILTKGPNPEREAYTFTFATDQKNITGVLLDVLMHPSLSPGGLSRGNGNFVLTNVGVKANGHTVQIASASADYEQPEFPVKSAIDGDRKSGWAVGAHEKKNAEHQALFAFASPIEGGPGTKINVKLSFDSDFPQHAIGRMRISFTSSPALALRNGPVLPPDLLAIVAKDAAQRNAEETAKLSAYYRGVAPLLNPVRERLAALDAERKGLVKQIPTTMISVAKKDPRTVRILPRGNWMDDSGPIVEPAPPAVLQGARPDGRRATRLDLAQWMVAKENPLTARVFVNRLWAQYFGAGLEKVLDDFGTRSEAPSHPELLDWLAAEFMESGWDVKHMVRLMLTSAAYRQGSTPTAVQRDKDPFNRLLARQGRFRLDAEMVRDNALQVAGLLSPKIGGRSVYPYQPDGYWDSCNTFTGPLIYTTDTGEEQYRRGLYTLWKRSFLHPSMLAFDAPTREECTADRVRSNTPLQALALLNDPSYVEAARIFAEHICRDGGLHANERIAWAYRRALSRPPTEQETKLITAMLDKHFQSYAKDPEAAKKLLSIGQAPPTTSVNNAEMAAWTSVARAILNLHETITRS